MTPARRLLRAGLLSAGAGFTPQSLSGLWLWLDATTLSTLYQDAAGTTPVTANGQPVGRWTSRVGVAYVAQTGADATRPTYATGAQHGLPGLLFDGGDYLDSVATTATMPITMVAAMKRSANIAGTQGIVAAYHTTNGGSRIYLNTGNAAVAGVSPTAATLGSATTFDANVPILVGVRSDGSTLTNIANDALRTAAVSHTSIDSTISVGRFATNSTSTLMDGYLLEVLVYQRSLSDSEVAQVQAYLNGKWGLY